MENILVKTEGAVGVITLNRPKALNALNTALLREVCEALEAFDVDSCVHAVVLTGSERAFAGGADVKEMALQSYMDVFKADFLADPANRVAAIRKPIIAAVAGYALGGGCELAMMCDFIIAADNAKFGQPEITLGILPGMGGSQRLTRFIGKSKAMEMCLTGRMMDAAEAERSGLVSRVVPAAELMAEAMKAAAKIAEQSLPALMTVKDDVNRSYETTLAEGLRFERRPLQALFGDEDQKERLVDSTVMRKSEFKGE